MEPITFILGSLAAQLGANLIGGLAAEPDRAAAREAANQAYQQILGLGTPPELAKDLVYKSVSQAAGEYTPELLKDISFDVEKSKIAQLRPEDIYNTQYLDKEAFNQIISNPENLKYIQDPNILKALYDQQMVEAVKQEDPRLKEAQIQALQQMQQVAQGGLRPEDRIAMQQLQRQVASDAQAKQNQIMQSLAQRGLGGSGAELAMRMQGAQQAAEQEALQSEQLQKIASQRALEAIGQTSGMAQNLRSSDLNRAQLQMGLAQQQAGAEADLARARQAAVQDMLNKRLQTQQYLTDAEKEAMIRRGQLTQDQAQQMDAITRFNIENSRNVQAANVAAKNAAAMRGQDIRIRDAESQNQFQQNLAHTKNIDWQNKANLGQSKANALLGQASNLQNQAANIAGMWSQAGAGVGKGIDTYYAAKLQDKKDKDNLDLIKALRSPSAATKSTTPVVAQDKYDYHNPI